MHLGLGGFNISEQFLLFTKHSNNIGLRENSYIFVPFSFSHLISDALFFDLHVFQTMLYNLLISAHAHLLNDTDHASKPRVYFLKHLFYSKYTQNFNTHNIYTSCIMWSIVADVDTMMGYISTENNTWTFSSQLEMSQQLSWSHPSSFALLGPQPERCSTARGMM